MIYKVCSECLDFRSSRLWLKFYSIYFVCLFLRLLFARCSLGATPLDEKDEKAWEVHVKQFEQEWKKAAEKIKKFNLLVS